MPSQLETPTQKPKTRRARVLRAIIEVAFIIFLFYSNLLMGEFDRNAGHGKSLSAALYDVLTPQNFAIGIIAALIGYIIVEQLRRRL
jgi:hypothetical protein